jgi:hypothetical protein
MMRGRIKEIIRTVLLCALVFCVLAAVCVVTGNTPARAERAQGSLFKQSSKAMWVWNAKIFRSQAGAKTLIDFCRRNNIQDVFVSAYQVGDPFAHYYKEFNARAHEAHIKVYALAGDPRWGLSQYHSLCTSWVKEIIELNKTASPEQRFDGISLDIEVYLLSKKWEGETAKTLGGFLDLHKKIARYIKDKAPTLMYGEALPFWFDDDAAYVIRWNDAIKYPTQHILEWVDYIAIMDYRNYADGQDGIIKLAKKEIESANTLGKKVFIGIETQKDLFPKYITFGGTSAAYMEKELDKVVRYYERAPSFAGIAVHHYESCKEFLR